VPEPPRTRHSSPTVGGVDADLWLAAKRAMESSEQATSGNPGAAGESGAGSRYGASRRHPRPVQSPIRGHRADPQPVSEQPSRPTPLPGTAGAFLLLAGAQPHSVVAGEGSVHRVGVHGAGRGTADIRPGTGAVDVDALPRQGGRPTPVTGTRRAFRDGPTAALSRSYTSAIAAHRR